MKQRVALVVSLLVPIVASGAEVKLEEGANVMLPADHTAHHAIHGMVDNLSSDLIALVGSFLFKRIYEETESTTWGQQISIKDLRWITDDVVEAKAEEGVGLRYAQEGVVIPWPWQKLSPQEEDKVVITDENNQFGEIRFSSNVTTNQSIVAFQITRNGKTYNFGPAADLAAVSWHPDGNQYAVANRHGLFIWDDETDTLKYHLDQDDYTKYRHQLVKSNMNWNPSDRTLAVTNGTSVKLYDTEKGEGVQLSIPYLPVSKNHHGDITRGGDNFVDDNSDRLQNMITCLKWNPKGDKLAIGCDSFFQTWWLGVEGGWYITTPRRIKHTNHSFSRLLVFADYSRLLPELLTKEKRTELQKRRQRWEHCLIQ